MDRILRADGRRRIREHDEARVRNHELARLVSFAFHEPKKFPDFEATNAEPKREVSSAVDEARVRGFFIGLAQNSSTAPSS